MVRKRIRRILSGGAVIFIVLFCTLDVSGQGFVGVEIKYTISGSTGISGVTMKGLLDASGQTVETNQDGYYSAIVKYGWSGTVTPVKEGYTFDPGSKPYRQVTSDLSAEDYVPRPITYTISGKVGNMDGVELSGLPGNPITGSNGSYSVTVEHGWFGTVTPTKEGYTFSPSSKGYQPVKTNKTTENYTPAPLMLLITGTTEVEGVVMKGLPRDPVTGKDGSYSVKVKYGWIGTVTPTKAGYEFSPIEQQYPSVTADYTGEDYTATELTFIVSGTTGMAGVQMKGLPNEPFTDENGYYTDTVPYGYIGTVTPEMAGYRFNPASLMLTAVKTDMTNRTFDAEMITLTISGTVSEGTKRLDGVEMSGLPGNPITGKDGSYSVTVDFGWSGTVMPIKDGYKLTPETKPYDPITKDTVNQSYSASLITYTISGNTTVGSVTMKGLPGRTAVISRPDGSYSATVPHGWSGTITPARDGHQFEPANLPYENHVGDLPNQDFISTLLQHKISGKITSDKGEPVADVTILADNNGGQATTDASGTFELLADYGWTGNLTPMKDGYTFRPSIKRLPRVTRDMQNQSFSATVKMFSISGEINIGGVPVENVAITASNGGGVTRTDARGKYNVKVPFGWSGDITPTKPGIGFNPLSIPFDNVTTDFKDGQPVLPKQPPAPAVPPVTQPGPAQPTAVPPGPAQPTAIPPGPAQPTAIPPGPAQPTAPVVGPPKTAEQQQLDALRARLQELEQQAGRATTQPLTPAAPPPDPSTALITNTWLGDELADTVLPDISQQAGIPIMTDETVSALITVDVKNMPLDKALDVVLAGTPYVVQKTPYYYLVAPASLTDTKFPVLSETRSITMSYISAEAAVGLLSTAFKPYAQAELANPPGTDTYTVAVTAPPVLMNRIVKELKLFDRKPKQILLQARIVAMSRTDLLNLGVEWGWPTLKAGFFAGDNYGRGDPVSDFGGKSPWGIQMGYSPDVTFTNALEMTLNLLQVNGEATMLSRPQTIAQDGKEATMKVVNEEFFFLTADLPTSQAFFTSSQLETIESGTTLTITPHIGDNNDIMMHVNIEVSDSIPRGRDTELPIVTRRTATNDVLIQDGGTVAMAGLTQNRSVTSHKRTPGLSNLPFIGSLFNNKDDLTMTQEVAVFVTAHILRNGQPARRSQQPQSFQPQGFQPQGLQPRGFQSQGMQPGYRQPGFQSQGIQPGYQQPSYQQPGYQPQGMQSPGYQPQGMQPQGYQPQGFQSQGLQPRGFQQDEFGRQPAGQAPVQPMMRNDFKSSLRESLSRRQR
ncbi:MAG: hypothetical protein CEE38_00215 [Planctomycetes bacterium B3_Pla]|nr:MAG: hypothetical protein CEE38_00215 [Planctomycetes bacterium B3_Pla]